MAAQAAIDAIHMAAEEGDVEGVARMLDEDPRLLSSERNFQRLLTNTAFRGHVGMVRLLLEKGVDINTPDADGVTALHHAAGRGYEKTVSLLLTSGADASRVDSLGWTVLMFASARDSVAVVRLLLRFMGGVGLEVTNDGGCTALWLACSQGRADVLRALLLAGADHTSTDNYGRTPRQIAQMNSRRRCVALIEWWEAEPQRAYVLHKARTLHEDTTTHQQAPAAPVPAYLRTRVQGGNAMPLVEVGAIEQGGEEGAAKRGREEGGQEKAEELCAMVGYVVKALNGQLYTELMQGLRR